MTNENEKQKYVQVEIPNMTKRGGWRGGGRPKGTKKEFRTVAIRIDERLVGIVERLKKEIANENHNLILKVAKALDEENITHFVEKKEALNNLMEFLKPYAD